MLAGKSKPLRLVIIGGGPGGHAAAIAGAQLEADVTLVECTGVGGSAVLSDVVPSKTLISTAEAAAYVNSADELGLKFFVRDDEGNPRHPEMAVNLGKLNQRILRLAQNQSEDMRLALKNRGVRVIEGYARIIEPGVVSIAIGFDGQEFDRIEYDSLVLAVGARPRELPTAVPDGERILTWKQLYNMQSVPEHLIVVGSGVTGAEFASAYRALGAQVTLVSSRDRVLPGEDQDAADVIEKVFKRNGMNVLSRTRAKSVKREGDEVVVTLNNGNQLRGSHCLMAVGAVPNTENLGLDIAGVETTSSGHIIVNRVARTNVPNIYATGDCTNLFPLASVASAQGRTAVFHALGGEVHPINLRNVASNVFTYPEIATVGWQQAQIEGGDRSGRIHKLDLAQNPRAKMQGFKDGFVKLITGKNLGVIVGGVIVAPRASELVLALSIAIEQRLTVNEFAATWAVYPSLSGSTVEAALDMHMPEM